MLAWLLVSFAIWLALAGGVWVLLFAHGEHEARPADAPGEE